MHIQGSSVFSVYYPDDLSQSTIDIVRYWGLADNCHIFSLGWEPKFEPIISVMGSMCGQKGGKGSHSSNMIG